MIYLNDECDGGYICFIKLDIVVKLKKGMVFFWNNLLFFGDFNFNSIYFVEFVICGYKIVIIKWFRMKN